MVWAMTDDGVGPGTVDPMQPWAPADLLGETPDDGAFVVRMPLGRELAYITTTAGLPVASAKRDTAPPWRVRSGLLWQPAHLEVFSGATWLSEGWPTASGGQVVGALHVHWRF